MEGGFSVPGGVSGQVGEDLGAAMPALCYGDFPDSWALLVAGLCWDVSGATWGDRPRGQRAAGAPRACRGRSHLREEVKKAKFPGR